MYIGNQTDALSEVLTLKTSWYKMKNKQHSRSILSGGLKLYITDSTTLDNNKHAIDMPSNAKSGDIFQYINKSIHELDFLKSGQSLNVNYDQETFIADVECQPRKI